MKLSVIMPAYNERRTIREIVGRVFAVKLDGLDRELVIVDDGSTDGTRYILREYDGRPDIKVVLQPRNLLDWLLVWRRVTWENRVLRRSALGRQFLDLTGGNRRREVVYSRGRSVDIEIEADAEEFEIDGDEFGTVVAARFRVDPAALIVRVEG